MGRGGGGISNLIENPRAGATYPKASYQGQSTLTPTVIFVEDKAFGDAQNEPRSC